VFPSSEIYGGFAAVYDYGHYGTLLKNNIRDAWWKHMVQLRGDVVGLMGSTGYSTGPHLHYEVLRNGKHLDPRVFILNDNS